MKIAKIGLVLAAAAIIFGSCCKCKSYQKKYGRQLVDTEWQLVQLDGRSVTPEDDKFTIVFGKDGSLSGVGACNRLMSTYTVTNTGAMKINNVATTMMACPGMEREYEFTKILAEVTHYQMDGAMMMLLSNGSVVAVMQAKAKK